MTPSKLREEIYREGQMAFRSGEPCPYEGWKAGTWHKGYRAADESFRKMLTGEPPKPTWDELSSEEKIEHLLMRIEKLEAGR